ncbi:hypothetical protein D6829_02415, partial [Candidatus Pacearchaeota archaeon]
PGNDVANIYLNRTEDGTENSISNQILAYSTEIMTTSTSQGGVGNNGLLIPTGSPILFSGSFGATRTNVGYITWELYKDDGSTQTLISSAGDQSTGGTLITNTAQTTYTATGSSPTSDIYLNSSQNLILKVYIYNNRNKAETYSQWFDDSQSYVKINAFDLGFVNPKLQSPLSDPQPNETTTFNVTCNVSCSSGACFGVNLHLQTNESGSWADIGSSGNIILNGTQENPVSVGTVNSTDVKSANFTLYANMPSTNYLRCRATSNYDNANDTTTLFVTVKDITPPTITLNSPTNNSYNSSSQINFTYTPSDNVNLSSCSLYIDGSFNQTNQTPITNGAQNSFTGINFAEGTHNWSITCNDTSSNSNSSETWQFHVDLTNPTISFTSPTETNNTRFERNWIFVNVSAYDLFESNITFSLYNSTSLVNQTTSTTGQREINWTGLPVGNYSYNVTIKDFSGRQNSTETRTLELFMDAPKVNLIYPQDNTNFSSYLISFNYSVNDTSSIANCSLYGNWSGGWHKNQTAQSPAKETENNFSAVNVSADGFYIWNVVCFDVWGNSAFNSSNFTFSAYLPSTEPVLLNASQSKNDGTGNITLTWNQSAHTIKYKIYYSSNLTNFALLGESTSPNFTDTTFSGQKRRFYRVSAWNPATENFSKDYFGAHVYTLRHNVKTKNWISFPTNFSYLKTANDSLNEITNATAFTLWNATTQKRVTCNSFSCPSFPSCTDSNCNFEIESTRAYEVNINSSAPSQINWSGVGIVYPSQTITLEKNSTSFGKNWIPIWANSSISNAAGILSSIPEADATSRWDSSAQTSKGYLYIPAWNIYVGTNFNVEMEEGYEVSVNQTTTWQQN